MLKPWVIFLTAFLLVTSIGWTKDKKICASPSAVEKFLSSTNQKRAGSTRYAATAAITVQTTTSGGIVLLDADPELLILSNSFDLRGKAVHFQPALKGRYTYSVDDTQFDGRASQPITLKDDDSFELIFKNFPFPYGKNVYVLCCWRFGVRFFVSNVSVGIDVGTILYVFAVWEWKILEDQLKRIIIL